MIFRTATNLTNSQPPRVLVRFSQRPVRVGINPTGASKGWSSSAAALQLSMGTN
jgi:hypothetical protein